MVIAITHAIFYWIHERHELLNTIAKYSRTDMEYSLQEGVFRLACVISHDEVEAALREALCKTLPNVVDTVVYVRSQDGCSLVSIGAMCHTAPRDGIVGECITGRRRVMSESGLDQSDPLCGLLNAVPTRRNKVICSPVLDSETDHLLAVLVAVCSPLSKEDLKNLDFLERQAQACFTRLKRTGQLDKAVTSSLSNSALHNNNSSILKLCADLYDQDAPSLQVKVVHYLIRQTNSRLGFLLLIDRSHREMFCQVIGDKILPTEIRFPINDSSFAKVLDTKQPITLADIANRPRLEQALGLRVDSMLCVPVLQRGTKEITAIACLVNKMDGSFTESDVEAVQYCFKFTATVLHSALAVQSERKLKNQTQALLQVAKNLFTHLDDLTVLLREIMQEARNLTNAERCSVFLVDKDTQELVAKVFDGDIQESQLQTEVTIPITRGIAGHVATTGQILNIDDAYSHPLFYRGVDENTGFKTRNILCFPIKDERDEVIGVAQLCNKLNAPGFSNFDVEIAQAFSVYCCISIVHSIMYKRMKDIQSRSQLANELMMYHMQIDPENAKLFTAATIPPASHFSPDFCKFTYTPRAVPYDDTPLAVLCMFEELSFIQRHKIKKDVLVKFILMVRRGYRDPPYHNWTHAFSVAHFCYLLVKNAPLRDLLDELEIFSLFVACLCHDIDHRGTNNSFQISSSSTLAALYSSEGSVLERHHFAQTMCILNTEDYNILHNFSNDDYTRVLDLIRDIILATDLAHHLGIMPQLEKLASEGYNGTRPDHHQLLLCLLMTSCDLSDQTKPWATTKKVAELIYQEFFTQGDLEKAQGQKPMTMMDRENACIPEQQIEFVSGIVQPVYSLLTDLLPSTREVLTRVEENKVSWVRMNKRTKALKLGKSLDVLHVSVDSEEENGEVSQS